MIVVFWTPLTLICRGKKSSNLCSAEKPLQVWKEIRENNVLICVCVLVSPSRSKNTQTLVLCCNTLLGYINLHIYTNTKIQYIPPNVKWATNTDSKTHHTPEHLDYVLETVDGVTGKAFALAAATQFLTVRTAQVNVPLLSFTAAASLAANLVEVKQSKVKRHQQLQDMHNYHQQLIPGTEWIQPETDSVPPGTFCSAV